MPRTKVARNVGNSNKRARDAGADVEEILRDYDIEVENSIQMLQSEQKKALREIETGFEELKKSIPARILKMKLKDIKNIRDFNEVTVEEKMTNLNITIKETIQKDEGYVTEGASNKSRFTSDSDFEAIYQNVSIVGELKSVKSRRRSQSASSVTTGVTPGPRAAMMSGTRGRTPLAQQPVPHSSRSKYRTPMSSMRQKAMSADRINTITPKVNPCNPVSMMRHARAGEPVFSLTGSPIVASNIVEHTANVNIPVADGIMSIRPQYMDPSNLDPSLVHKIDEHTFNHLRTLKANLDILMAGFNRKFAKK